MSQEPIEIILLRQLASYLTIPIWIANAEGELIYYNEPAERLLGRRFDEAGQIGVAELAEVFTTSDLDGTPIPNDEVPLTVTMRELRPAHRSMRVKMLDGSWREIEVSSLPLLGQGDRFLGALVAFWEAH